MLMSTQVLLQLGYSPITSKSDNVFLEATQKALKVFGQSSYRDIMTQLHSKTGMSEIELIKNFNLFEDALKKSTGTVSAKIIVDSIKDELIKYTHLKTSTHKIEEIIAKVEEYGVYDFLINLSSSEHILVLYKDHETIELMLSDFFSKRTQAPFGLVSEQLTKIKDIRNITYEKLSGMDKKDIFEKEKRDLLDKEKRETVKKLSEWINNMHSCNTSGFPTRFADQDCTWYVRNELGMEHMKMESSFGQKPTQQIILLCAYDVSKISPNDIESLIKSHGYVIMENKHLVLYKSPQKTSE
jgi:hypothetical protein